MSRRSDAGRSPGAIQAVSNHDDLTSARDWFGRVRPAVTRAAWSGVFLLAVSIGMVWIVQRSLERLVRGSLQSILSANVTALEMWLDEVADDAAQPLQQSSIREAARAILNQHAAAPNQPRSAAPGDQNTLALQTIDYRPCLGWALLNVRGTVLSASTPELVNLQLPIPDDALERVFSRQATVCRPFKLPIALPSTETHYAIAGGPLICALAPVTDEARVIGCLALLIDPLDRYAELLTASRIGDTGETYALDRLGVLISPSRFEPQLRAAGLLDRDPRVVSLLNVACRDPGVDLTRGAQAPLPGSDQPLTVMADQMTRGATGANVHGYHGYRGVPVVGAWRWLPAYGMGVATEIDVAEAYRPVNLLRRGLYGLLLLASLVAVCCLLVSASRYRIHRHRYGSDSRSPTLGNYQLGELIGQGAMGNVYRGHHQLLRRDVAIKVLKTTGDLQEPTILRFEREVQLTARLRHPNTIDIYDFGRTADGTFFYVMEFVDGITLQELVDRFGRQPPARVIHLLLQICGSISEAHQLGMIHRDIKPSNILLTARCGLYDMIKVLDFGLVKQIDQDLESRDRDAEMTSSDGITGTPMYMSPETVRDAATADAKSDLYSVGAVGYILLTGWPLFESDSSLDVCLNQLNDDPIRPAERIGLSLPEDLQNVLMSCLRKSPEERPLSADALADSLQHCQDAGQWSSAQAMHWWEVETV